MCQIFNFWQAFGPILCIKSLKNSGIKNFGAIQTGANASRRPVPKIANATAGAQKFV
jgi:hypothetical protein